MAETFEVLCIAKDEDVAAIFRKPQPWPDASPDRQAFGWQASASITPRPLATNDRPIRLSLGILAAAAPDKPGALDLEFEPATAHRLGMELIALAERVNRQRLADLQDELTTAALSD